MTDFPTLVLPEDPTVVAPDGSEVRVLLAEAGGSMAHFRLHPGEVSVAVQHRSVTELWFVTAGAGRMWRRDERGEQVSELTAGTCLSIPVGTGFQFRCDSSGPLDVIAVTMPPWPGDDEAFRVDGVWHASVRTGRVGRGNDAET